MAPSSNWNVRCTLAFYPALTICTSLATSAPLAAYILLRTGSNVKVGLAVGAQGVANLLAAFPAAWLGDRWSRPMVIRVAAALGVGGMSALGASVLSPGLERHERVQYGAICGALLILGLFMGGHSSSVEALFGDSVESGRRSALYARKSALKVLGNAAGPLVSIAVFASLGDEWRKGELEVVIACGCCFFVLPAALACSLGEAHTLGGSLSESLLSGGGRESESAPRKTDRATEVRIAATVCAADVVSMLGSGMTIKFFPLFFWKEVGLTPIQVQVIYVLAPSGIAACSLVAQRASRRFGRVQTTVATKLAGISLLVAMSRVGAGVRRQPERTFVELLSQVGDGPTVVVLYLLRTWLMNCCMGLTRSVLNDYVPKRHRAKWNSLESVNTSTWAGSAVIGGLLSDRIGYTRVFLITAALQALGLALYVPLAAIVALEERPPKAAPTSVSRALRSDECAQVEPAADCERGTTATRPVRHTATGLAAPLLSGETVTEHGERGGIQ